MPKQAKGVMVAFVVLLWALVLLALFAGTGAQETDEFYRKGARISDNIMYFGEDGNVRSIHCFVLHGYENELITMECPDATVRFVGEAGKDGS